MRCVLQTLRPERPRPPYPAFVLVGAAASALAWWAMSHGAGISPDSVIYLGVADSIRTGAGFVMDGIPVTHFPPGYPLLLAAGSLMLRDSLVTARVLAALGFGVNVALVATTAYVAAGRRLPAAVVAILIFGVSGPGLMVHTMAWSEGPFFAAILSGMLALTCWATTTRHRYLFAGAASVGAAMVIRYAGLPLLVPLAVAACWLGRRRWRERLVDGVLAICVAIAPLAAWLAHNVIMAHQPTDRVLVAHPVDMDGLRQLVATLADYFLPVADTASGQGAVLGLVVLMLLAGTALSFRQERRSGRSSVSVFGFLALITSGAYVAFILASISFADATTPLDERILFPVFGVWAVALAVLLIGTAGRTQRAMSWWGVAGFTLLLVLTRAGPAMGFLTEVHASGEGYVADDWQRSELLEVVRELPQATVVYSNAQDAVEFLLHRPGRWLPDPLIWESMQPNPAYEGQRAAMCREMAAGAAVVAFFTTDDSGDSEQQQAAAAMCAGARVEQHDDGALIAVAWRRDARTTGSPATPAARLSLRLPP